MSYSSHKIILFHFGSTILNVSTQVYQTFVYCHFVLFVIVSCLQLWNCMNPSSSTIVFIIRILWCLFYFQLGIDHIPFVFFIQSQANLKNPETNYSKLPSTTDRTNESNDQILNRLTYYLHNFKSRLREYEKLFEQDYGRKPTNSDKYSNPKVRFYSLLCTLH